MKNKNKIGVTLAGDYLLIAGFYLLLSLTGLVLNSWFSRHFHVLSGLVLNSWVSRHFQVSSG